MNVADLIRSMYLDAGGKMPSWAVKQMQKATKPQMPGRRLLKLGKPNANQRQRRKRERQLRGGGK